MKLHIRENLNNNIELQKDIKKSIRTLAALDTDVTTYEELEQLNSMLPAFLSSVKRFKNKGLPIEDCIDYIIQEAYEWLKLVQKEYNEKLEYDKKVDLLSTTLNKFLQSNYIVLDYDKNTEGCCWTIEAPTNATHEDCIDFVDSIVATTYGKYSGTGRGGSWSKWWIVADGVRLEAGWKDHSNNWEVTIPYKFTTFTH
jgi:hypothetical protein